MTATAASGLIELRAGRYTAVVSTTGGSLARLTCDGRPLVLDSTSALVAGDVAMPLYSGAVLAPWPNRIADGRYDFDGVTHQLPVTEVERGSALHGLVLWNDWTVEEVTASSAVVTTTVRPQPGYPFTVEVGARYEVHDDGLHVTVSGRNRSARVAPFGASIHPYLVPGVVDGVMDEWSLVLPLSRVLDTDPVRLLPRETIQVRNTRFDFRDERRLAGVVLDHAYTHASGRRAVLTGPDGFGVSVSWDERCPWLQVCTIDAAPGQWRRSGLAVEPMTCPPDAFRSGSDLWRLAPGERRAVRVAISATES